MNEHEIFIDLALINVGIFLSVYMLFSKLQGYFALDTWHGILLAACTFGIVSYLSIISYCIIAYIITENEKQKTNQENVK